MSSHLLTLIALGGDPKYLLIQRMNALFDVFYFAEGRILQMHAAVALFGFVKNHANLIQEHIPSLVSQIRLKAQEIIESKDESSVGCLLHDICKEVVQHL